MRPKLIGVYKNKLQVYKDSIRSEEQILEIVGRKSLRFSVLRFTFFVGIFIPFFLTTDLVWSWSLALISTVIFGVVIYNHNKLLKKRNRHRTWLSILEKEYEALKSWKFTAFDGGGAFAYGQHPFVSDLGVFGNHSVFQMVNRTHPEMGKSVLAERFLNLNEDSDFIRSRQASVKEMGTLDTFRKNIRIALSAFKDVKKLRSHLIEWVEKPNLSKREKSVYTILVGYHIISAAFFLYLSVNGIGGILPGVMPLIQASFIIGPLHKRINATLSGSDKMSSYLKQNGQLVTLVTQQDFKTPLLNAKADVLRNNAVNHKIDQLTKGFARLEFRLNLLAGFLLNYLIVWDVIAFLLLEKQKSTLSDNMSGWLSILDEFDAEVSLGNFASNMEGAIYPELLPQESPELLGADMNHPLIEPTKSVGNSVHIEKDQKIKLVTGANMAGKSTFLRTMGISIIMTSVGLPIFAKTFRLRPGLLFTSMLTSDNLSEETSYFLAEVDRLRAMVDYVEKHDYCYLILDEILKGTNSYDKERGSYLFLRKLIQKPVLGIAATHDLALTKLEEESPEYFENLCFEVKHSNEKMFFDYTLRKGITQTMNAMLLLKQKGLV